MAEKDIVDPYNIEVPQAVAEKLKQLPGAPGVYIMKDGEAGSFT